MAHKELPVLPSDANLSLAPRPTLPMTQSDSVVPPLAQRQPAYPPITHGQVMTDEQLETLRRQISVYATICQQLVEMHKAIMAQHSAIPGLRLGQSIPFDPAIHSTTHKLTSRQRWTPSPTQLQILEKLFEQGSGTPNKQRIKEITTELSQYGQISETNVYNWFQNRRARTKRKQQLGGFTNGESELDTDVDSPEEKRGKVEWDHSNESFGAGQTETNLQSYDSKEHYHFDTQKGVISSQVHAQLDSSVMPFNITVVDGQRYTSGNLSGVGLLENCKSWEVKNDSAGPSASQDSQGQVVIGAEESLNLFHNTEKYSFTE